MDGLFANQERAEADRKLAEQERQRIESWRVLFGWDGPEAGGYCDVGTCVVPTPEGSTLYCYCEQVRLIEQRPDGLWLAEIDMGEIDGKPWPKNGRRVLLDTFAIHPPMHVDTLRKHGRAA